MHNFLNPISALLLYNFTNVIENTQLHYKDAIVSLALLDYILTRYN